MQYREHLLTLGLSEKTVRAYSSQIRRAVQWSADNGVDLCAPTAEQLRALADTWPKSNASRRQLRSALRHWWAMHEVRAPEHAIRVPKRPRGRWRGIEDADARALLRAARTDWPRGGAVYLALYLGLRREEIATLRWSDFDPDMSWVTIHGKMDRTRYLPVHPRLQAFLKPNRWPTEFVFPGRLGGHITPTTVNKWISELAEEEAGLTLTPHQLRHTSGGRVNDQTRDIHVAQIWLGHADVSTTQIYTRVAHDRLLGAMQMLNWENDDEEAVA